jgi:SAM-dependent methyltransferase
VIATAYSGNLDFMDDENSYLVPSGEGPIPEGADPYPEGGVWGEPDLDEAARLMRSVYERPDEARERGRLGQEAIREGRSVDRAAEFVQTRLAEIDELRAGGEAAPAEAAAASSPEIDAAERYLVEGPSVPIRAPSRLGPVGVFARRVVYRLLRPYMVRQREWELAVVGSLRELEREDAAAREAGRTAERRLTKQVADATERADRAQNSHDALAVKLSTLDEKLHHRIYTADPDALMTTDPSGRPAIGYRGAGEDSELYAGFEDVFRGPEQLIRDRQRVYVGLLRGHEPVLDVGCGRGELLDLLREAEIEAKGVDLDEGMVARARANGHEVELADANTYLEGIPDGSLGTVFSAQVIEHLPYDELKRFLRLAHAKLRPDGLFVAETVNPYAVNALRAFWVDLTHQAPIYPEVAVVLCRLTGFAEAWILFPTGSGEIEQDRRDRGEYAVVARRGS